MDSKLEPLPPLSSIDEVKQKIIKKYNYIFDNINVESFSIEKLLEMVVTYYESIIDCMPGNVYWLDKSGKGLGCNYNVLTMFKLRTIQEFKDLSFQDMQQLGDWSEEATRSFTQDTLEVIKTGKAKLNVEEPPILNNEGNTIHFLTSRVPLFDKKNIVNSVVGISVDITQQKKMEASLQKAKIEAEAANQAKTQFIRNMEHDIRTPFNGIWALADLLYEQEEEPTKKEYLAEIANAGKELLNFCNTILDFSKIESGRLPLLEKKFELTKLIKQVCDIESPAMTYKKLQFELSIDKDLPRFFRGDEHRITRILINLLSNSIKFTMQGKVSLIVSLLKKNENIGVVKITVADTGVGIPTDKLNFIYEKFSKLVLSNKNLYRGNGLGLYIIKQFVHELAGEIEVESKVNEGTAFTVLLPLKISLAEL